MSDKSKEFDNIDFNIDLAKSLDEERIINIYLDLLDEYKEAIAFSYQVDSTWLEVSYSDLVRRVKKTATLLVSDIGLEVGDRVAVLSKSLPQYIELIFAASYSGVIVVPIDCRCAEKEVQYIIEHSSPKVIFVDIESEKKFRSIKDSNDLRIINIEPSSGGRSDFDQLRDGVSECIGPVKRERERPLLISYTSGTMGTPKGVELYLKNLLFEAQGLRELFGETKETYLSVLPMNHIFELVGGIVAPLTTGSTIYLLNSVNPMVIIGTIRERRVTRMLVVPLVLEMFKYGIERNIKAKSAIINILYKISSKISRGIPSLWFKKLLFWYIHKNFGGRLASFVVGGAKLPVGVYDYFTTLGFQVYQGYGLTETSPVVSVNCKEANRRGSVGRPLRGVSLKISEKGVISVRGPNLFSGYYRNRDESKRVLSDGWFNTGDIGHVDADGFLFITGREKNLIVLKSGKKVYPEEVEAVFLKCSEVKEVAVLSRRIKRSSGEQVEAIVVPVESEITERELLTSLNRLREELSDYKWPVQISIYRGELPRTSTKKIKRKELPAILEFLDQL